jgi:hypothetical protein
MGQFFSSRTPATAAHAADPEPDEPEDDQQADDLAGRYCEQKMFYGHDAAGNFCDVASGTVVPAFIVAPRGGGNKMCLQFCLPIQNSLALKTLLQGQIGLCCRHDPGYNNFQGSLNESVPGFPQLRVWQARAL